MHWISLYLSYSHTPPLESGGPKNWQERVFTDTRDTPSHSTRPLVSPSIHQFVEHGCLLAPKLTGLYRTPSMLSRGQ